MDVKSSFYNIKYIFSIGTLGNFGFCCMKLDISPFDHGSRLIIVRLSGFTS